MSSREVCIVSEHIMRDRGRNLSESICPAYLELHHFYAPAHRNVIICRPLTNYPIIFFLRNSNPTTIAINSDKYCDFGYKHVFDKVVIWIYNVGKKWFGSLQGKMMSWIWIDHVH